MMGGGLKVFSKQDLPLDFFDELDDLYISIITYMEILGYDFESQNEKKYIRPY